MTDSSDDGDMLVAAFDQIAEVGWSRFSLSALAQRLNRPLAEVYAELPGRAALLTRLGRRLDRAMLAGDAAELAEMSPRERVFELVMRRLEAMAPFRAGLKALARDGRGDLELVCASGGNLRRLGDWLGDAAGLGGGLRAMLARQALRLVYARSFAVWLADETADQAATMAELDRRLGQLDTVARWCGRRSTSAGAAAAPAA